ncbi:MAG: NTP transferase domain-containing protein [Candidatus Promineofilum sp.]|nr:NTP transferase domain-containing protein [Promineifilum sp.]
MGRNKMLLPWGESTVLGRTLDNVRASVVSDVIVVTGHEREEVEAVVASPRHRSHPRRPRRSADGRAGDARPPSDRLCRLSSRPRRPLCRRAPRQPCSHRPSLLRRTAGPAAGGRAARVAGPPRR